MIRNSIGFKHRVIFLASPKSSTMFKRKGKHRKQIRDKPVGNVSFFCGGISTQANKCPVLFVLSLLFSGVLLFFVFPYRLAVMNIVLTQEPELLPEASAGESVQRTIYACGAIVAILAIICLVFFSLAALLDPGILPREMDRAERKKTNGLARQKFSGNNNCHDISNQLGFCQICYIFQPHQTQHCPFCNNCVERFDHHCPWVGNCIGRRNYRFFISFLFNALLLEIFCFIGSGYFLFLLIDLRTNQVDAEDDVTVSEGDVISCGLSLLYCFIMFFFNGPLLFFHCSLIYRDTTTAQVLRIDLGATAVKSIGHLWRILFEKIEDSKVDVQLIKQLYRESEGMQN